MKLVVYTNLGIYRQLKMLWKRHRRSVLLVVGVTSVYLLLWFSSSREEANVEEHRSVNDPDERQQHPAIWYDHSTSVQAGALNSLETQTSLHSSSLSSSKHNLADSSLMQSLIKCSVTMGISEATMERSWDRVAEVSRRARLFLDQISPYIPQNFSTQFRNPCWEAENPNITSNAWENAILEKFIPEFAKPQPGKGFQYSRYLMKPAIQATKNRRILCLPYFFLAGFPKSGTTTVHDLLTLHPNIVSPRAKEPHWWTRALGMGRSSKINTEYIPISLMAYILFFKSIAREMEDPEFEELITYDGSQSTLWDSNFYVGSQDYCAMPAVMRQVLPEAKFVVVMRDPVTRLYSHFTYSCQLRHGNAVHEWPQKIRQGVADLFHREVVRDIEQFNNCVKNASVFECSSMRTANTDGPEGDLKGARSCSVIWHRLMLGMYVVHIKKWLQFYPRKNFLFLRMEDFFEHSREVLSNLTEFLGIAPGYRAMSEMLRERKNSRPSAIQPMLAATSKLLQQFYHQYNAELALLLQDRRYLWED